MDKFLIFEKDIKRNVGLNSDPAGFVFYYKNKLFRAISPNYEEELLYLFNCGAIKELINNNLIPETKITNYYLNGFDLVIEHQKIDVVTYPTEWSFTMLKDAALLVIMVNKILLKYGYETKDAHGFNVIFDYCSPKFIDIGSFGKKKNQKFWRGYNDYRVFFLISLKLWSNGNIYIARKLINNGRFEDGDYEYFNYKHPLVRYLPQSYFKKYFFYAKHLRNLPNMDIENMLIVKRDKIKRQLLRFLLILSNLGLVPNNNINFTRLERKVKKIKAPRIVTRWGNYHSKLEPHNAFKSGERFDIILQLLKKYEVKEILEIGGNQGLLSKEISKFVPKVICSDYDEIAVDIMYLKAKKTNTKITPVLLDFLKPTFKTLCNAENVATTKRLNSETLLVCALTHHLLLKQKVSINEMFSAFSKYANKFLFVEFMPGGVDKNPVPTWYNINWFRTNFTKYFKILFEVHTASDGSRILFVGKKL